MTPALQDAIRLLEQSRRELVALMDEQRGTATRAEQTSLFEILLDIREASVRHDDALEVIRARLQRIERAHEG